MRIEDLNNKQLGMIDATQRKPFGKAGQTIAEASDKKADESEKADQRQFRNFCGLKGIWPGDNRMDKRSTAPKGALDFALGYGGRCLYLEFKHGRNKLTPEQEDVMRQHAAAGNPAFVVRSVSEAIDLCYQYLPLKR